MVIETNADNPSATLRIVAIVFCPVYLLLVAAGFSALTAAPFAVVLPAVVVSATAITAVLVVFGVKAYRRTDRRLRFNLGTVLLLMVPVCIYLMALQQLVRAVPPQDRQPIFWVIVTAFGLFFAFFTTAVLLHFAEAVMWLALAILRRRLRSGRNR